MAADELLRETIADTLTPGAARLPDIENERRQAGT